MTSNQRVAVVTGSSTGNGYETSLTLARNGFLTYATMRNLNKGENIKTLAEKYNNPKYYYFMLANILMPMTEFSIKMVKCIADE